MERLKNKKIIIYGVGSAIFALKLILNKNLEIKKNVIALLDDKFSENFIYENSYKAYNPSLFNLDIDDDVVAIIVTGKSDYFKKMKNYLIQIGVKNIISVLDIFEYNTYYNNYEFYNDEFWQKNEEKIKDVEYLFKDHKSKNIFENVIRSYKDKKIYSILNDNYVDQYFPKDIEMKKGIDRFVDCGAYNGDTLMSINKSFKAICFEPDEDNYNNLCNVIKNNKFDAIAIPCGVSDKNRKFTFDGGILASGSISDKGNTIVQCVSMDDCISTFNPTMIKMDIECFELKALAGAENIIKNNKPDLAIAVYHLVDHIWEIPLYLNSLNLGYKFYLRNYSGGIIETILYATI